jgi:hypothetical protein
LTQRTAGARERSTRAAPAPGAAGDVFAANCAPFSLVDDILLDGLTSGVSAMVFEHHKLRPSTQDFAPSAEAFRRADLVDVSLGAIRFGLSADHVRSVKAAFADAGFQWRLVTLAAQQFRRTPLCPLPMMHW